MRLNTFCHLMLCATLLFVTATASAQQTRILTPDRYSDYGLVYALPLTALEVEITATHTLRQAGPFHQYAPKFIGTDKVIDRDSESWQITDVKIRRYGIANDSSLYRMQLKANQPLSICVADDGMLLAVNTKADLPAPWQPLNNPEPVLMPAATEYLQYVPEDFNTAQSDLRRAALLAAGLADIRQSRLDLTRGDADNMPTDGKQLELMLQSLDHQEELLLNAFRGRQMTETRAARFTLVPDDEGRYVLARLSNYAGFVNRDDLSGAPIYVDIKKIDGPEVPLDEKGNPMKMPRDGVMYILPGTASVTVLFNGRELTTTTMEMSQFGTTFALDPALFTSKKSPAYAIFDPATGALRELGEQPKE